MTGDHYVAHIPLRWTDIDMYQHLNNAITTDILQEARVQFLHPVFGPTMTSYGLLITEAHVFYKGQLRLEDSPLQVRMWISQMRSVDFMIDYEMRSAQAIPEDKPAVIAQTRLVGFDLTEQKLSPLHPEHKEYLQRFLPTS